MTVSKQHRILIININTETTVGTFYLFKKANCVVDTFSPKIAFLLKNKYCDHWFEPTNIDCFVAELKAHADVIQYDWIVPANDATIRFLNKSIQDDNFFQKVLPLSKSDNRALLGSRSYAINTVY